MPRHNTTATPKKPEFKLVEVHGQQLTVTSLVIAELYGRRHDNILKDIDKISGRLHLEFTYYMDSQGKKRRMCVLNEEQFLIAMPFIGGTKALEGQIRLVQEFLRLRKLLSEPGRKDELKIKQSAGSEMTDMLKFVRETEGKDTTKNHYTNEHLFCNRALNGTWAPINDDDLDVYDAKLLAAIRRHNQKLMTRWPTQKDRRKPMDDFVADYRAKNPRMQLH
jgi:Rha family phage regulatory protein